jgi:hypothetical protein
MSREHTSSFAFMTNYFWGSCLKLSQEGASINEIKEKYESILEVLCSKYRPAPEIWS